MNRLAKLKIETYIGIFFVALSSLMFEFILLKIFSTVMAYHFVFVCISLALFGTVGNQAETEKTNLNL